MLCRFSIFFMNTHIFSILNVEGVSSVSIFWKILILKTLFFKNVCIVVWIHLTSHALNNFLFYNFSITGYGGGGGLGDSLDPVTWTRSLQCNIRMLHKFNRKKHHPNFLKITGRRKTKLILFSLFFSDTEILADIESASLLLKLQIES